MGASSIPRAYPATYGVTGTLSSNGSRIVLINNASNHVLIAICLSKRHKDGLLDPS
jgi:hypothetical protein